MKGCRASAFGALLAAILAACSSSGGAVTPTPLPTATPVASNAKELEVLLPDSLGLGAVKLVKASYTGSDFVKSANSNEEFETWLTSMGKSLDDVSAAVAFPASGTSGSAIFAFRVNGVDSARLIDAFKATAAQGNSAMTWMSTENAGKNVQQSQDPDTKTKIYLYGTNDLIFIVSTNDAGVAQEALAQLP
jgi:hypothetical protein